MNLGADRDAVDDEGGIEAGEVDPIMVAGTEAGVAEAPLAPPKVNSDPDALPAARFAGAGSEPAPNLNNGDPRALVLPVLLPPAGAGSEPAPKLNMGAAAVDT